MAHLLTHWKASFGRAARLITIGLLVVLAGCVQKYPVAYFARAGDTIILGLGGIQRNTNGATKLVIGDLQMTITNTSTGAVSTLTASTFFKAFPDYSSTLTRYEVSNTQPSAHLVPFDGGWFVTTTLPSDPNVLPPGSYTISITSPTGKLLNTKFALGSNSAEGDLTQIPLQIVAGTGGNSSYNQQFAAYATGSHLDISPPASALAGVNSVGGLQLVINYPQANYNPAHPPMVLPYSHNPYIQLSQNIIDNGNGTKTLVVLLSAQQGFVASANQTPFTPVLSDLSLSLINFPASGVTVSSAQMLADFQIDQSRSKYYDIDGNAITSLSPAMTFP